MNARVLAPIFAALLSAAAGAPAAAQWGLFGFTESGDLVRIDPDTGARTAVGNIGVGGIVGAGWGPGSALYAMTDTDRLLVVDPLTVRVVGEYAVVGRPPAESVVDIAFESHAHLAVITTDAQGQNAHYRADLPGPLVRAGDMLELTPALLPVGAPAQPASTPPPPPQTAPAQPVDPCSPGRA